MTDPGAASKTDHIEGRLQSAAPRAPQPTEQGAIEEILALEEDLERARVEAAAKLAELESRLSETQAKASEAEHDAELRIKQETERAKREAVQAAGAQVRKRMKKLEREKATIEGELVAVRRQLGEANGRAVAAERHAREIEVQGRRELEVRLRAIEVGLREVADSANVGTTPAWDGDGASAAEDTSEPDTPEAEEPGPDARGDRVVSLSNASFEELRAFGMSVTQAKRAIAYRERLEGFESFKDLDRVPGFPKLLLAEIRNQLR